MKITEALCDWIEDAGGTATEAEQESIVNAIHTLYTAMGGEEPEVMPDDIATWVQYLSTVAGGGGGSTPEIVNVTVTINNPSQRYVTIGYYCDNGDGYAWIIQAYKDASKTVTVGAASNSVMAIWATGQTATISDPVNCDICVNNVAITMPGGDGGKGGFVLPYWGAETASFSVTVEL